MNSTMNNKMNNEGPHAGFQEPSAWEDQHVQFPALHGGKGGKGCRGGKGFRGGKGGKGQGQGHAAREHEISLALEMLAIRRRMIHMSNSNGTTPCAQQKLAKIAKREAFLMNRMIKIQKAKACGPRRFQDVVLNALPEDPGCVIVDARFLIKNDNATAPAGAGQGASASEQADAQALKVQKVERIVAFFAARGIRHVIVVPEAAAADPEPQAGTPTSVQPSNRVGDSIIALVEQETKNTGADDVTKNKPVVVVSARPCLLKRAVRAGAMIMLPKALKRMVCGAKKATGNKNKDGAAPPTALAPVLIGKDADDDLLEAAVLAIDLDGPADQAANGGPGDEDHEDHDLAIAIAVAQGFFDGDEESDLEMITDASKS